MGKRVSLEVPQSQAIKSFIGKDQGTESQENTCKTGDAAIPRGSSQQRSCVGFCTDCHVYFAFREGQHKGPCITIFDPQCGLAVDPGHSS